MMIESFKEKRRHKRFKTKDRLLASLCLESESNLNLPYHVIDISSDGLAIRYLGQEPLKTNQTTIKLFYGESLLIDNIKALSAGDQQLKDTGPVYMRRRGMQFVSLSPEQQSRLEDLIQNYTSGTA